MGHICLHNFITTLQTEFKVDFRLCLDLFYLQKSFFKGFCLGLELNDPRRFL